MTIGIGACGPHAGRAVFDALAAAEKVGTGAIGGFVTYAAIGEGGGGPPFRDPARRNVDPVHRGRDHRGRAAGGVRARPGRRRHLEWPRPSPAPCAVRAVRSGRRTRDGSPDPPDHRGQRQADEPGRPRAARGRRAGGPGRRRGDRRQSGGRLRSDRNRHERRRPLPQHRTGPASPGRRSRAAPGRSERGGGGGAAQRDPSVSGPGRAGGGGRARTP